MKEEELESLIGQLQITERRVQELKQLIENKNTEIQALTA